MHRIAALLLVVALVVLGWFVLVPSTDPEGEGARGGPTPPASDVDTLEEEDREDAPGPVASVTGHVLAATGERAGGARVRIVPLDAESWPLPDRPFFATVADDLGRFAVRDLPPGFYRVEARTEDGRGYRPLVRVREGRPSTVVVKLGPIASISGYVATESGVPVPGATVSADLGGVLRAVQDALGVRGLPLEGKLDATTDGAGAFEIGGLPAGQFEIEVRADGYVSRRVPGVNAPNRDLSIRLVDTFEVVGTVRWEAETPPKGLRVVAEPTGATATPTPDRGFADFVLPGLPRGVHAIRALAEGFGPAEGTVRIEAGSRPEPVELVLPEGVLVKGRVRAKGGGGLAATVEILAVGRAFSGPRLDALTEIRTDAEGRFETRLAPGEWVFRPRAPGYVHLVEAERDERGREGAIGAPFLEGEVVPVELTTRALEFELVPGGRVEGRVTHDNGWPVAGAEVSCSRAFPRRVETDGRGRYVLDGVPLDSEVRVSTGAVEATLTLSAGRSVVRRDLVLPRGPAGTVRGRVLSDESEPVPDVTVLFEEGFAVTDLDGRFERRDVRVGTHSLRFFAPGYAMGVLRGIEVREGQTTEAPLLVLPWRAVSVSGRVTDETGLPLGGARVTVHFGTVEHAFETTTDGGGWFRQEGPGNLPGPAVVTVRAAGYAPVVKRVEVRPDTEDLLLRLEAGGSLRIRVTSTSARARPLTVELERPGYPAVVVRLTVPPGHDSVELPGVPPGRFRVEVRDGKGHRIKAGRFKIRVRGGLPVTLGPIPLSP